MLSLGNKMKSIEICQENRVYFSINCCDLILKKFGVTSTTR